MKSVYIQQRKMNPAGKLSMPQNNIFGGGYSVRYFNSSGIVYPAFFSAAVTQQKDSTFLYCPFIVFFS